MNGDDQDQLSLAQQMQRQSAAAQAPAPPPLPAAQLAPEQPQAVPPEAVAKPFHQVLDEYHSMTDNHPALHGIPLPEWSQNMNTITGTKQYDEGLNDSALRRGITGLDLGLHHFGGESAFGPFVKPLFHAGVPTPAQLFGGPHEGFDLPALAEKGLTSLGAPAPVAKGGAGLIEGLPTVATGLVGGPWSAGLVAGAQTYGETGRFAPAALATVATRYIPESMKAGGQQALKLLGAQPAKALAPELGNLVSKSAPEVAKTVSQLTASGPLQVGGEFAGKQLGLTANMLGTQVGQAALEPNKTWEEKLSDMGKVFSPANLVTTAVSQLPFTAWDLYGVGKAPAPIKQVEAQAEGQFADAFTQKWMEDRVVPPTTQEIREGIDRAKKGQPDVPAVPTTPQEEQMDLFGTQVKEATRLAEERLKKPDAVGEVLASMGETPMVFDQKGLNTPVITKDEAWPMTGPTGAMETVRARANDMLVAQGVTVHSGEGFQEGHEQSLYSAVRATEGLKGGPWSKEELTQIAASRMVDAWQKDKTDLQTSGYRPAGEFPPYPLSQGRGVKGTQAEFEDSNAVMAEVKKRISPTIPTEEALQQAAPGDTNPERFGNRVNPDYDQKLAQKIALISGDKEHWLEAGIPENLVSSIWQNLQQGEARVPTTEEAQAKLEAITGEPAQTSDIVTKSARLESALPGNIIDIASNLGPKMYQKMQSLEQAIQEEVAKNGFFTTNTHNDLERSATAPGERAVPSDYNPRLEMLQKQLMELVGLDKAAGSQRERGGIAPLADVTAEAYKAALKYGKDFDITNPDSVSEFVKYIRGVIRNKELEWSRVRVGEPFQKDTQGNVIAPDTREQALAMAAMFQKAEDAVPSGDYKVKYTVPPEAEPDGKFRIVRNQYVNTFLIPEREGLGKYREGEEEETGLPSETGQVRMPELEETTERPQGQRPLEERLNAGEATFDDLQENYFSKRFMQLGRLSDSAEREARKGALAANMIDFINHLDNTAFSKVVTDKTGASRVRDPNNLKKQFIRYIQFMREGGHVDVVSNRTGTGLIGSGDLRAFNNFMRGVGLGVPNYPDTHKSWPGQPRLSDWNRDIGGANFFEKFNHFSMYMGQYMLDPRKGVVDGERRPDGDFGYLNPTIGERFMDKVTVPWADGQMRDYSLKAASDKFPDMLYGRNWTPGSPDYNYSFKIQHNPIADLQIRSTENDLFSRAHKVVDLYERYGNVDPQDLAIAKMLLKSPFVRNQHVGFSMTMDPNNKGYFHTDKIANSLGILVDPYRPTTDGRVELQTPRESFKTLLEELGHSAIDFAFHSDLNFSVKDQYLRNQLLSFRDEATAIHKFLSQHRTETMALLGTQVATDNLAHALSDPREMLAQVMSNPDFRTWLSSVPDTMDHPLPLELGFGTNMFQRLWNLVKRAFSSILGPDGANTMLERLAKVSTRGAQLQDRMRLINTPDIYNFLQQEHRLNVERLESLRGQPIVKGGPSDQTQATRLQAPEFLSREPGGVPVRPEAKQQLAVELLAAKIQLQNIVARQGSKEEIAQAARVISDLEAQVAGTPTPREPYEKPAPKPQRTPTELEKNTDPIRKMLWEDVQEAKMNLSYARFGRITGGPVPETSMLGKGIKPIIKPGMQEAPVSKPRPPRVAGGMGTAKAQEDLEYAQRRLAVYDSYKGEPMPRNIGWQIKDIDSAMSDAKIMLQVAQSQPYYRPGVAPSVQRYQTLINDLQGIRDRLTQTMAERSTAYPPGEVLESRGANPQRLLDVVKTMGTHDTEDLDGKYWIKPYNLSDFRRALGPVLGDKLKLDFNGNQMGYSFNLRDLNALTPDDIARMPPAFVKPWAPSLWESMKGLIKADGSSNETAEAVASTMLQYGALLHNTDYTTWGMAPKDFMKNQKFMAAAWNPSKYVAMSPEIFNPEYAGPQSTVVHETTHTAGWYNEFEKYESPDVQQSVRVVNTAYKAMTPNQRKALMQTVANITGEDLGRPIWFAGNALTDPNEFAAHWMGHIGDMVANVPDKSVYLKDQMRFVPDEMSRLLQLTTWRRLQGLDHFADIMERGKSTRGFTNELMPVVHDVFNVFKGMSRSALEIAEDISDFQRTRLLFPDAYRSLLQALSDTQANFYGKQVEPGTLNAVPRIPGEALESRMPPAIEKLVRNFFPLPTSDGRLPRKLSLWDLGLTQFSQFASKYPIARSFYDMLATSRALSQTTRIKMMTALAGAYSGGKVLDDVRTGHVADFMKSPQLRDQFSKIALDLNLYGDTKFNEALGAVNGQIEAVDPQAATGWLTPQFVNTLMDKYGVPASKRDAMRTILDGTRNQINLTRDNLVASHTHALQTLIAKVVSTNSDLNPEASRTAAETLMYGMEARNTNPDLALQKLMQFQAAVKNPEVYARVYDLANDGIANISKLDKFLELRAPYFMSERRPGSFGLIYKDAAGKVRSQYYANGTDRDRAILSKNLTEGDYRAVNPQDRDYGISQSVFGILDQVHDRVVEKLTPLFGADQAKQLGQVLDYSNELRNSLNARDVLRTTTGRELAPGREELDMFSAHQHYLNATTAAIRNRFIKLESELLFTDPAFANQPYIKDFVNGHVQAVLQPDGQIGRTIQQLSFLHYLWGNVSSMMMQLSHQVMGLAPMLTSRGASVAGSYNTLKNANLAVMDAKNWFGGGKGYADKEIGQMVERAKAEGVITSWIARELDHSQDLSMVNRMRVTQGLPQWKQFDMLKNGLYQGYNLVRRMYDLVPVYNSEVAFVASLMHLKSAAGGNLKGEQLYREAAFLKDNTMFPGGKENRPGMFQYVPRSAAQALWSLQTYANGLTTMMGEFVRRSINPKGAGLTPAQGAQVRKAAAQMLIAQTAIGGVMAMPFAGSILFALQKLFPDHDIEGDVRKTLANLAGDDGALGQSLSSIMMNGVPNSFSYGPDVGSRFALAGVFHVSPYSGVGWEQLTGPVGGVISQAFQGAQAGLRGDPMGLAEGLMPTGFKRIYDTLSQGQTYQTGSGRIIANDLSPVEIASRIVGFRPARVARIEDLQNLNKVAEDAEKAEQTNWTSKQVKMLGQGRDSEVQQNIAQRVEKKRGVYPAKHYADVIAQEYANQNMPVNLRRYGNRATVLAQKSLRGVLGTQTEGPGEMDRLQMQQQIAQRLGMGGPPAGRWRHANAVDNLVRMYPHLTNSQANLLLSHAAGSRPPPDLYSELLSSGE